MIKKTSNPFKPGAGGIPKYVAGRDEELSQIKGVIDKLCGIREDGENNEEEPEWPLFIIGPRGVGKTVLLNITREYAQQKNVHVVEAEVEFFANSKYTELIKLISGKGFLNSIKNINVSIPGFRATMDNPFSINAISNALDKKLKKSPVLFLIDEAHGFDTNHFREFCKLVQKLQSNKLPLGVIYAGTPGLENLLLRTKATFISRYKRRSLQNFDNNSTKLVLSKTAEKSHIIFDNEAVNFMANLTDNYPYFVQMIGEIAWDKAEAENKLLCNVEDAKNIVAKFNDTRDEYYRLFNMEIFNLKLRKYTYAIIQLFNSKNYVNSNTISKHLINVFHISESEAVEIYYKLYNLGIYRDGKNDLEPSIPSFFNYFLKKNERDFEEFNI